MKLPTGWELKRIEEIADVKGGKRLPKGYSLVKENTGFPYIRVTDMKNGTVDESGILYVPVNIAPKISRYIINKDDVFISVAGNGLGITGIIPESLDGANLTENADKLTNLKINQKFLFEVLRSPIIQNKVEAEKTQNAQPKLALTRIKGFEIPVPPLSEQKKIAKILSTWDKAITTTEQLLTNSTQQKKALMQQLLTGKKRLPGFSGEWEKLHFSDIADLNKKKFNPQNESEEKECIELEHISQGTSALLGSTTTHKAVSTKSVFTKGCILFGKLRPYLRKYWLADREGVCSTEIWVLSVNRNKSIPEYLHQLVQMDFFIDSTNVASGTHMPRADWNVVKDLIVFAPELEEQQKIATILSTADKEIEILQQKLDCLKQEKKALMQQLLTGKRRVNVDELEVA
ncbi:restriction endonuclease subunit S [Zooshikella marina]|uniref:restriction endonuclease subunit S n=1 Tax=Zooshikella ganghwensis TaxID=202772 RepID=UPI001BAE7AD3|nr:restriction endonuclease subunit S [Zooshikella ganghwensis]MBU2706336.1 restriction endonuclease subunit S [Zooshikella ganghwensis]